MSAFNLDRIAASGLVGAIDYHDRIGSTSDQALLLGARDELSLPLLVLAEHQTAGRGRGTNQWTAGNGALTFSLVIDAPPNRFPPRRWPQVALAAGVAVLFYAVCAVALCYAIALVIRWVQYRS